MGRVPHLQRQNGGVPADMLVGRRLAVGALRSAVDAAVGGAGGVVLLAGEAGMGKTALASEAVAYAKARGATAVWGTCWEGGGAPGFWPWIQVVRALAAEGHGTGEAVLAELTGVSGWSSWTTCTGPTCRRCGCSCSSPASCTTRPCWSSGRTGTWRWRPAIIPPA